MKVFFTGLFILILIAGCESKDKADANIDDSARSETYVYQSASNLPQLRADLEREYAEWKSLGIQNYEFSYNPNPGAAEHRVTVKNGKFQNLIYYDHEISDEAEASRRAYTTIDAIFDDLESSFAYDEARAGSPAVLGEQIGTGFYILYNPQYHYPTYLQYTYVYARKPGDYIVGNWNAKRISKFTPLEEAN